uniref:Uncharacterized protein n=1 Tax=Pithovirus LCPAC304 TaxID=2506594 RepID=A0A481Z9S0_9VIRU|nr:MAG: hypothetical protein LCPAC304_04490 [Pithovirus LCPAC304]
MEPLKLQAQILERIFPDDLKVMVVSHNDRTLEEHEEQGPCGLDYGDIMSLMEKMTSYVWMYKLHDISCERYPTIKSLVDSFESQGYPLTLDQINVEESELHASFGWYATPSTLTRVQDYLRDHTS